MPYETKGDVEIKDEESLLLILFALENKPQDPCCQVH